MRVKRVPALNLEVMDEEFTREEQNRIHELWRRSTYLHRACQKQQEYMEDGLTRKKGKAFLDALVWVLDEIGALRSEPSELTEEESDREQCDCCNWDDSRKDD